MATKKKKSSIKQSLKQHFIPHEGNNYHPHILHTKRAVFYGATFLAMKLIVVIFAVTIPVEAFLAPDVLAQQGRQILALTNELRKEKNLPVLTEVTPLDTSSQMRADDMSAKQYFSHVGPDGHVLSYFLSKAGYAYSTAGENLAVGFSDANDVITAWEKSPTHYANLVDGDFKQIGIGLETGIFEGKPVVFVAQHFGTPLNAPPTIVKEATAPKVSTKPTASNAGIASNAIAKAPSPAPVVQPEPKPIQKPVEAPKPAPVALNATEATTTVALNATTSDPTMLATDATSSIASNATSSQQILGTDIAQKNDGTPLAIIQNQSSVEWSDTNDHRTRVEVRAAIVGQVKSAIATVNGTPIELTPTGNGMYTGSLTLAESSDDVFKTVIGSSLTVTGADGSVIQGVIDWAHPKLVSQNPLQKYFQAKSWLGFGFSVFNVSRWMYVAFIIFFMVALGLSIFIQIKKQHPHVIVQTMTLLGLLVCLYIV